MGDFQIYISVPLMVIFDSSFYLLNLLLIIKELLLNQNFTFTNISIFIKRWLNNQI